MDRFLESAAWLASQRGHPALACTLVPPSACRREKQKAGEIPLKGCLGILISTSNALHTFKSRLGDWEILRERGQCSQGHGRGTSWV